MEDPFKGQNQTVHGNKQKCYSFAYFSRFRIAPSSRGVRSSYLVTVPQISNSFWKKRFFFHDIIFSPILITKKNRNLPKLTKICQKLEKKLKMLVPESSRSIRRIGHHVPDIIPTSGLIFIPILIMRCEILIEMWVFVHRKLASFRSKTS